MKKVDLGIWSKLTKAVGLLLGLVLLAGVGVWYLPLIQQNQRIRLNILHLTQEIQREEAIGRQLQASINALQKNPKTVERLARQNLGFCKPGETVIRFEAPPAKTSP
jgi:cell division protein FtsB